MEFVRVFPASLLAPSSARRSLDALIEAVPLTTLIDLRIIMSEFVTNAVQHAALAEGDPITVRVVCSEGVVHIEVQDDCDGFAPLFKTPEVSGSGGWGLYIVGQLADRWGTAANGVVWAEVDLPAA